jgi:hypothetical protein
MQVSPLRRAMKLHFEWRARRCCAQAHMTRKETTAEARANAAIFFLLSRKIAIIADGMAIDIRKTQIAKICSLSFGENRPVKFSPVVVLNEKKRKITTASA